MARTSNSVSRIWIVEMRVNEDPERWAPTVGVGLTRHAARIECDTWRQDNPADKFRVREYVRQS